MEVLAQGEKVEEEEKGQDVEPVGGAMKAGEKPRVGSRQRQGGHLGSRLPFHRIGWVHEKGATFI